MAEGVGFEPTVRLPVRLISSQVHSTTLPPFQLATNPLPEPIQRALNNIVTPLLSIFTAVI